MSKTKTEPSVLEPSQRLLLAEEEIASLCGEILERYEEASVMHRLSQSLATVLGETSIARLVVDEAKLALQARSAELWLQEKDAVVLAAAGSGQAQTHELHEHGPLAALRQGRPWTRDAGFGHESIAAVPLPAPDRTTLGVLVLRGLPGEGSFRTGELKILSALACLASAFIRNDRMGKQATEAEARDRGDELSRDIQGNLQFAAIDDPGFEGIECVARCIPSNRIGADLCGTVRLQDGSLLVVLAKPSRSGTGGAIQMGSLKGAMMAIPRRCDSPARILDLANEALAGEFVRCGMTIDAFVALAPADGRQLEISTAGETRGWVIHPGAEPEGLEQRAPCLGSAPTIEFGSRTIGMAPESLVVVASRGLCEARDGEGREFGREAVANLAARHRQASAAEIHRRILEELYRHCPEPQDDISLVIVRARNEDGERNPLESAK